MALNVLRYNLLHLPGDIVEAVGIHNFFALTLALFYYIGGAFIIYGALNISIPFLYIIWMLSALINIALIREFPGLFYLDDTESSDQKLSLVVLGPINFLRAFCLGATFVSSVGSIHPFTIRQLFKTPPTTWAVDDEWIKAIQRSRDIAMPTLVGNTRWAFRNTWRWLLKVGNMRISTLMVLKLLLSALLLTIVLAAIIAVWLKLTGRVQ